MLALREASRRLDPKRARLAAVGVATVLVALLVGQALPAGPGPSSSPGQSQGGPITWTAGPDASLPPASPLSWTDLSLPADDRLADLTATRIVKGRVATTSHFTLRSLGAVTAADLAAGLRVEPAAAMTVEPGLGADTVTLIPTKPLRDGTLYRFRLTTATNALVGTWAFKTDAPLHVVGRLPDDATNDVPTTTGIEVTFDRDSPTDFAAHFSISPKVDGRFERHDRTWVFVPLQPLALSTIYTVTVSKGVGAAGSDQVLEADVRWQFKTEPKSAATDGGAQFDLHVYESRPGEGPVLGVDYWVDEGRTPATSWPYELYRLPNLDAAAAAIARLQSDPYWANDQPSASSVIDTKGLQRVASGKAALESSKSEYTTIHYLRLPVRPDPGFYVVVLLATAGASQAVLQVTDLAAFVQTTDTRMVAWLSDLRTQAPIAGATVAIRGGAVIGRTDAAGILLAATPAALVSYDEEPGSWDRPSVLTITGPDGRGIVASVGMRTGYAYPPQEQSASYAKTPWSQWWLLLSADRSAYRSTDTIHAWGVLRSRSDLSVPTGIELRLETQGGSVSTPVVRRPAVATSRGVFSVDLPIVDLPHGSYQLSLYVGSERVESTWIDITEIHKPAYQVELTTVGRAFVAGESIVVNGQLVFYDGSTAPGITVKTTIADRTPVNGTAGADGRFRTTLRAAMEWQPDQGWNQLQVVAAPSTPEEGQISGETSVTVFPAKVWLAGEAALSGSQLSVTGTLTTLDLAAVEAQLANGEWELQPAGSPLAGRQVGMQVIHLIPVRTQIGTAYDFITKRTEPTYSYSTTETVIQKRTLTTDSAGRLSAAVSLPVAKDDYRIELTGRDSSNRLIRLVLWTSHGASEQQPWSYPYLVGAAGCGPRVLTARLGEVTDLTVHEADGSVGRTGQYLFMVGERGLADAVRQSSATLRHAMSATDLPSYEVRAVRLMSTGYQVLNPVSVHVDAASKAIVVSLTPARAKYRPGEAVSIAIRTTGPDGKPIAADVVVRAVDEKLFDSGGALDVDASALLLREQPDGFLQSYTSHQLPYLSPGCGGMGGTGGRSDFRDSATFQRVTTGADGRATVSFTVPDDLTSWHVTATAVSGALDAGSASVLVPVGLPFFVDGVIAPEYLAGEQPVLMVRAYGDALRTGNAVSFTVRAPDLGLDAVTVNGRAFEPVPITLPAMTPGRHQIRIEATAGGGSLTDALVRTVDVVPSRVGRLQQQQQPLTSTLTPTGGDGLTTYVISDAGRGQLVPILRTLVEGNGARADQAAAAAIARQLLIDEFKIAPADLPPASFDESRYVRSPSDGFGLLPYASADLELTARIATVAPELVPNRADLAYGLRKIIDEGTRDRTILALAGLAGLGEDVLEDLRAIDPSTLSIRERLWLGIGLLAAGDETAARAIERGVLSGWGEQLGPWVRVTDGRSSDSALQLSGLTLQLAGGLGDELGAGLYGYVASQPSKERIFPLETLGYVRGALERLPGITARFAWSLDGQRHEVTLEPGATFALTMTPAQRRTFSLERLSGELVVSSSWIGPADTASLPVTSGIKITRSVTPATDAPRDKVVHVILTVAFGDQLPVGDYAVTDLAPSGLAPLVATAGWPDEDPAALPVTAIAPYAADGQRVSWVLTPASIRTFTLAYSARVVSPGTFAWEPAVVQSLDAAVLGSHTAAASFTIR